MGCVSPAVFVAVVALGVLSALADGTASIYDLRVNGMAAPANVGAKPSFSWKTRGGAADRRQTAVRVTVRRAGAAACWSANVLPFFAKYFGDMRNWQRADGVFTEAVPTGDCGPWGPSPGWTDAIVVMPYLAYRRYGDLSVLRDNWDVVRRYLKAVRGAATPANDGPLYKGGSLFGDWLADGARYADKIFVRDAYWLYDLKVAIDWAVALGDAEAEAGYRAEYATWRPWFRKRYVKDGKISGPTQLRCAMALRIGALDEGERAATSTSSSGRTSTRASAAATSRLSRPTARSRASGRARRTAGTAGPSPCPSTRRRRSSHPARRTSETSVRAPTR